ncbi:hypothetical protein ABIE85_008663 [Bradyrhizobium diazoefficiens]|jgi:hypothetical protein|uniref:hypothetical protein n=1 Tax=Bradyrhizobium TaxID=374 RepID=UPI00272C5271|nr:hypothetical protein [Bradyrhizobium diazoefficiens]WLA58817.1 hypothetical protein QIH81_09175 [Bradyrhizobium diazoefficiens]
MILLAIPILSSCAARTPYVEPPVVDMGGVDQNRYNADLSACTNEKIAATSTTIWTNDMISVCMERKGYRVLSHKG